MWIKCVGYESLNLGYFFRVNMWQLWGMAFSGKNTEETNYEHFVQPFFTPESYIFPSPCLLYKLFFIFCKYWLYIYINNPRVWIICLSYVHLVCVAVFLPLFLPYALTKLSISLMALFIFDLTAFLLAVFW